MLEPVQSQKSKLLLFVIALMSIRLNGVIQRMMKAAGVPEVLKEQPL